jgi:hypothetical protein
VQPCSSACAGRAAREPFAGLSVLVPRHSSDAQGHGPPSAVPSTGYDTPRGSAPPDPTSHISKHRGSVSGDWVGPRLRLEHE